MEDNQQDLWFVVVNDEEQHSIWQAVRELPGGWRAVGEPRTREACLDYIRDNWTDIRPKSVRDRILRDTD